MPLHLRIGATKRKNQKSAQIDLLLGGFLDMSKTLLEAIGLLERDRLAMDEREVTALIIGGG